MTSPVATFDDISVSSTLWSLGRRLGIIETAEAWRALAESAGARVDNLRDGTRTLRAEWSGDDRDSFVDHVTRLVRDLETVESQSAALARHADGLAELATNYQEFLNQSFVSVLGVPKTFSGDQLIFSPRAEEEVAAVQAAVEEAQELRAEYDEAIAAYQAKFTATAWTEISGRWQSVVTGSADPFDLPAEADGISVLWVDGAAVVNTGTGDDNVNVSVDPETGQVIVEVNGVERRFPPGTPVTVRAGEGDDVIEVAEGMEVGLVLLGGAGSDRIQGGDAGETVLGGHGRDEVYGGDGDDYVSAGSGRDYVDGQGGGDRISGGHGDDVLYGLGTNNDITGGEGDDYIEGGKGNDTVHGGAGDDILSGGRGDDTVAGGSGDDVVYGGLGSDTVDGGSGADKAYTQSGDQVDRAAGITVEVTSYAGFINIEGSPEFVERVQADLDMYRASPTGRQMMERLQDLRDPSAWPGHNNLTIRETDDGNSASRGNTLVASEVSYNPSRLNATTERPPSIGLYHELGHVYSYWNDNYDGDRIVGGPDDGIKIAERQATGLLIDHDGDSGTPDRIDPDQPLVYTENGLRDEMWLDPRDTYR